MRNLLILFLLALVISSCRSQDLIRPGDSIEVAYEKAMNQFVNENFSDAARAFETVVSIGRGTDVGQDAQFYLAESYYKDRRFLIAASEYQRYAQFHPNSTRREQADFMQAKSYYQLSPRYRLDQTYTRQAIEQFRLFTSRYPNSEMVEEAAEIITELREKLARKQFTAAEFYMRTNRYNAAAVYYDIVIDEYPETRWAERSVARQIEAYILFAENSVPQRQEERFEKALASYDTYLQLFPRGEYRDRVERLYERARRGLEEVQRRDSVAQTGR